MTITHVYYNPFSVELILCRAFRPRAESHSFVLFWKQTLLSKNVLFFFVCLSRYGKLKYKTNKLNQCIRHRLSDVTQSVLLESRIPWLSPWPLEGRLHYLPFNRHIRITSTIITFRALTKMTNILSCVKQRPYQLIFLEDNKEFRKFFRVIKCIEKIKNKT